MTKNTNFYFTVHRFMTRDLGLRGSALTIYAIIYSFSSQGKGTFFASREELAEFSGVGVWTVTNTLKELVNSDLIYIAKGKKHEHKEYRINTDKLKNQSAQNSHTESVKITHEECENHTLGVGNSHTESVKIDPNNKHNNKQYNKPIINVYKGASAPEREKEKDIFKEDFKGDKSEAPTVADTIQKATAEQSPISIGAPAGTSLPSHSRSGYAKHQGGAKPAGTASHGTTAQQSKYCHFDPEEAFRLALARTEEWVAEIDAKEEAKKRGE